jgi:membrane-associated phospholipid phosphatase
MTATATPAVDITGPGPRSKRIRYGWLIETVVGIGIYFLYDSLRDRTMGTASAALKHAKQVVDVERFFGIYQEHRVQHAFLEIALVAMYRKTPARYVRWRNTLLFMLGFGLIGFWLYPLTPPRLMPSQYDFVDTAAKYFNFGPQQTIKLNAGGEPTAAARAAFGNLYAAMPSLHVGWSTWSALALIPLCRRWWLKVLVALDPIATIFAIVVTGNHWILDAVGGWVVLALGYGAARLVERVSRRRPVATGSPA